MGRRGGEGKGEWMRRKNLRGEEGKGRGREAEGSTARPDL